MATERFCCHIVQLLLNLLHATNIQIYHFTLIIKEFIKLTFEFECLCTICWEYLISIYLHTYRFKFPAVYVLFLTSTVTLLGQKYCNIKTSHNISFMNYCVHCYVHIADNSFKHKVMKKRIPNFFWYAMTVPID